MKQLSEEAFAELRKKYKEQNDSYKKSLIFHVGTQAGFYSEVGCMMECICWCHLNEVKFILYADDANFSQNGWNDFFESFCEESHDPLNRIANYRAHPRFEMKIKFIRYFITYAIRSRFLKLKHHVTYITSDVFQEIISPEFKRRHIEWDIFQMNGTVYPEIAKLFSFATHFNSKTRAEIDAMKSQLELPDDYVSIQIRGGDKFTEARLISVQECLDIMKQSGIAIQNLFVFTDDFRNIEYLREHTDWNLYYLVKENEQGYVNSDFLALKWEERRKELIKLFAMVEICIDSRFHFGCESANPNNYIKNYIRVYKEENAYFPIK